MKPYTHRYIFLLLLLIFMSVACNQADELQEEPTPPVTRVEEATATPETDPQPATKQPAATPIPLPAGIDEDLAESHNETIRFGRALVAHELGLEAADLTITAVEVVDWPDGCLGMGQLNEGCTEAIVPGLRIHLSIEDQIYEVRTDLNGQQYRWAAIQ